MECKQTQERSVDDTRKILDVLKQAARNWFRWRGIYTAMRTNAATKESKSLSDLSGNI